MSVAANNRALGFTLVELLVVLAIIASASAAVSLALRDTTTQSLQGDADRLINALEVARMRSQASASPITWRTTDTGFAFDGLQTDDLPVTWQTPNVTAIITKPLLLGPEAIILPYTIELRITDSAAVQRMQASTTYTRLFVATDGLRPFSVVSAQAQPEAVSP